MNKDANNNKDKLNILIEKYWKLVTPDPEITMKEMTVEENDIILKNKFGEEIFNTHISKYKKFIATENDSEKKDYVNFMHEKGLFYYANTAMNIAKKETLKSLTNYLKDKGEITLLDLGCEDGRVSIGLALALRNVEHVIGVDWSRAALDNMKQNIEKVGNKYRLMSSFDLYQLDFTNKNKRIDEITLRPDVTLMLFPDYTTERVMDIIRYNEFKSVIVSTRMFQTVDALQEEKSENIRKIEINTKAQANLRGMNCELIEYKQVTSNRAIFLGHITK